MTIEDIFTTTEIVLVLMGWLQIKINAHFQLTWPKGSGELLLSLGVRRRRPSSVVCRSSVVRRMS